jgi:iron complex transport system permease protein
MNPSNTPLVRQYKRRANRHTGVVVALVGVALLTLVGALCCGEGGIRLTDLGRLVTGHASPRVTAVLLHLRLPRVLAALAGGCALGLAGAVMQSILRNPLASPYTLGLSNAAAFGAAVAIVVGGAGAGMHAVAACAFVSSLMALGVILMLAGRMHGSSYSIVLSGIVISSLFGAALSGMQYVAGTQELAAIVFWTFGDLGRAGWQEVAAVCVVVTSLSYALLRLRWDFRALASGDEYARSLGMRPRRVRVTAMVLATLITATVVSCFGVIAFIGLVVPHLVRLWVGDNETHLLPASAAFGALFLLVSDTLARTLLSPVVLPVGILTSVIGAPLFLVLLLRRRAY